MYLRVYSTSIELCNPFLSIHVILNTKSYVLHFIQVALYGHVSRRSVRSLSFVTKLKKYFYSFGVWLAVYSGSVTC